MNYSPLRYPGGKSKIAPLIRLIIEKTGSSDITYIEPFAGGAGVALSLLIEGVVDQVVINDYDKAIYSFWRALKEAPQELIDLIEHTPLTIDEWKHQKDIYSTQNKRYSVELGFAAFYLNRTNRSGILSAGPIGGYNQTGNYGMDARFNRDALIGRIQEIAKYKSQIVVYNKEIRSFISGVIPKYQANAFVYFDPPYFENGQRLYKNLYGADLQYFGNTLIVFDGDVTEKQLSKIPKTMRDNLGNILKLPGEKVQKKCCMSIFCLLVQITIFGLVVLNE